MKNCKKRNASFDSRIFAIALVTMLAATTLWAKPKDAVEYTPFKSENPNTTVFECKYIKGTAGLCLSVNFKDSYGNKAFECSSIAVYGWKKKKGGWEKLGEYQPNQSESYKSEHYVWETVLNDGSNQYTHYAVEIEAPENSLTFSAKVNAYNQMVISFEVSEDYKKLLKEKRAAEEAEQKRLAAEEKAKRNAARDAKGKEIAKGYVYHGIEENERSRKLFTSGALEEGHAYYISGFVVKYSGTMAAIEYGDGLFFSSRSSSVYVDYIDQKIKGDIVEAGVVTLWGTTIESPLTVVVTGGKAPLHRPVVIGFLE